MSYEDMLDKHHLNNQQDIVDHYVAIARRNTLTGFSFTDEEELN
jgi:hypothetical protein